MMGHRALDGPQLKRKPLGSEVSDLFGGLMACFNAIYDLRIVAIRNRCCASGSGHRAHGLWPQAVWIFCAVVAF